MPRDLTSGQITNILAVATRPIYLIVWEHSGSTERLSCSGDITFNGNAYTAAGASIRSMIGGVSAEIQVPATATRVGQVAGNDWRRGTCQIYAILGAPGDSGTYSAADGVLLLDGVIERSRFSGSWVQAQIISQYFVGKMTPLLSLDAICNHLPAPGSAIPWEGESQTLEVQNATITSYTVTRTYTNGAFTWEQTYQTSTPPPEVPAPTNPWSN